MTFSGLSSGSGMVGCGKVVMSIVGPRSCCYWWRYPAEGEKGREEKGRLKKKRGEEEDASGNPAGSSGCFCEGR
jgi:hypothetical protein